MEKSTSIANIGKALSLFQTKMEKVKKDSNNPYFKSKYASLSNILESIQLPMAESGLAFSQLPDGDSLTTILIHPESGEFIQSSYSIKPIPEYTKEKDRDGNVIYRGESYVSPQAIGSAVSYARRYALCSILGINVGDEDDDGNHASGKTTQNGQHTPGKIPPNPATKEEVVDNRPWLSEKGFNSALDRINNGEVELWEKIKKEYRMKKDYWKSLEDCVKLEKSLQK